MTIRIGALLLLGLLTAAACGSNRGGGGGGGGADSGPRSDGGGPRPGGGSGVDRTTNAADVTPAEQMQLCAWLIDQFGGDGVMTTCAEGTVTGPTMSDCIERGSMVPDTCPATVGDAEDCYLAISADPCILLMGIPPACSVVLGPMCVPS